MRELVERDKEREALREGEMRENRDVFGCGSGSQLLRDHSGFKSESGGPEAKSTASAPPSSAPTLPRPHP